MMTFFLSPSFVSFFSVLWGAAASASTSASNKALSTPSVLTNGEFWATLFAFILIATLGVEYLKKWGLIQTTADKSLDRLDRVLSVLWPDKTALGESPLGHLLSESKTTAEYTEEIHALSVPSPGKRPPAWCCFEGQADQSALKELLVEVKSIHRRLDSLEIRIEALEKRK